MSHQVYIATSEGRRNTVDDHNYGKGKQSLWRRDRPGLEYRNVCPNIVLLPKTFNVIYIYIHIWYSFFGVSPYVISLDQLINSDQLRKSFEHWTGCWFDVSDKWYKTCFRCWLRQLSKLLQPLLKITLAMGAHGGPWGNDLPGWISSTPKSSISYESFSFSTHGLVSPRGSMSAPWPSLIYIYIYRILIVPPISPTKSSTLTFETNHFFESHVMVSWMLLKLIEIL